MSSDIEGAGTAPEVGGSKTTANEEVYRGMLNGRIEALKKLTARRETPFDSDKIILTTYLRQRKRTAEPKATNFNQWSQVKNAAREVLLADHDDFVKYVLSEKKGNSVLKEYYDHVKAFDLQNYNKNLAGLVQVEQQIEGLLRELKNKYGIAVVNNILNATRKLDRIHGQVQQAYLEYTTEKTKEKVPLLENKLKTLKARMKTDPTEADEKELADTRIKLGREKAIEFLLNDGDAKEKKAQFLLLNEPTRDFILNLGEQFQTFFTYEIKAPETQLMKKLIAQQKKVSTLASELMALGVVEERGIAKFDVQGTYTQTMKKGMEKFNEALQDYDQTRKSASKKGAETRKKNAANKVPTTGRELTSFVKKYLAGITPASRMLLEKTRLTLKLLEEKLIVSDSLNFTSLTDAKQIEEIYKIIKAQMPSESSATP